MHIPLTARLSTLLSFSFLIGSRERESCVNIDTESGTQNTQYYELQCGKRFITLSTSTFPREERNWRRREE